MVRAESCPICEGNSAVIELESNRNQLERLLSDPTSVGIDLRVEGQGQGQGQAQAGNSATLVLQTSLPRNAVPLQLELSCQ